MDNSFVDVVKSVFGCSVRTTVRYFRNLPTRTVNFFKRKYSEYKAKPKRKDINRIYVLVGYITKESADMKYRTEQNLISLKRALLLLIFVLIFIIALKWALPFVQLDQYKQMFGINSVEEMTRNDPFTLQKDNSYIESDETSSTQITLGH